MQDVTGQLAIVELTSGKIRGERVISDVGKAYWRFLGIPYAQPPLGELRFKRPLKPIPWSGIRDAFVEASPCAGRSSITKGEKRGYNGSDDCLYLNIFTNDLNPDQLKPVFVYIYGGGFASGNCSVSVYSPDYLLMKDIVVVSFNHRFGPLGFLSLKDKDLDIPGNMGLRDQQMVLEFVRENIKNFGGDPLNVTLAGHSSGAACVGFHCLSESSRGLFQRAIMLGSTPLGRQVPELNSTRRIAEKLEFSGDINNEKEILKFLETVDALDLVQASNELLTQEEQKEYKFFYPFCPCVEPYVSESSFLTENVLNLMETAWSRDIDIMFEGVAHEGRLPYRFRQVFFKGINLDEEIPLEMKQQISEEKFKDFLANWENFYSEISENEQEKFENMLGDFYIWFQIYRNIRSRQKTKAKGKTFVAKFAVDSPSQNFHRLRFFPGMEGTTHGDELSYTWKNEKVPLPSTDSMEFKAIENFTTVLTNFMRFGDPKISGWNSMNDGSNIGGIITNEGIKVGPIDEIERVKNFWEKVYDDFGMKFC